MLISNILIHIMIKEKTGRISIKKISCENEKVAIQKVINKLKQINSIERFLILYEENPIDLYLTEKH